MQNVNVNNRPYSSLSKSICFLMIKVDYIYKKNLLNITTNDDNTNVHVISFRNPVLERKICISFCPFSGYSFGIAFFCKMLHIHV